MSEPGTAQVIQFPVPVPGTGCPPRQESGRSVEALAALDEALAAQRAAVARWRHALADLRRAARELGESARTYRDGLDALSARIASARSDAAAPAHETGGASGRRDGRSVPHDA